MKKIFLALLVLICFIGADAQPYFMRAYFMDSADVILRGRRLRLDSNHTAFDAVADSNAIPDIKYLNLRLSGVGSAAKFIEYSAAADGDSTFHHDTLVNNSILLWREGELQSTSQYTYTSGAGTITGFKPKLLAGERVKIQYGTINNIVISPVPPIVLRDIYFQTVVAGITQTANVWSGTDVSASYSNFGLADSSIMAGDTGYIVYQVVSGSSDQCIYALNDTHTNQRYQTGATFNYEVGMMLLSSTLYVFDASLGVLSTGITVSGDVYLRIHKLKSGANAIYTVEKSTTTGTNAGTPLATWSAPLYTFTYNSDVRLYPVMNIPPFTNFTYPKCLNCK